jgi:hypothetical protein
VTLLPWLWTGAAVAAAGLLGIVAFTVWGSSWGAGRSERDAAMAGDDDLDGGPPWRVVMTRAVSVRAPVEVVWPWVAQIGRGAGWYSIDRLDNGGRVSARHIVSWIPEPRVGDATAIGYLRHLVSGRELAWWMGGEPFLGVRARMVMSFRLTSEGDGATRLVSRVSGDAAGTFPRGPLWLFRLMDSVMARKQLLGIRERAERYAARVLDPTDPETGARDQYQLYEVVYASGETAGVPGTGHAARWHREAMRAIGSGEGPGAV